MSREIRVGLLFSLALVLFGTALYFLGNLKEMVRYKIQFDKVIGLERDSPVQFRGVPIGRVTKIVLDRQVNPSQQVPIIVTIAIHRSAQDHIRTSTVAGIRAVGMLGDKSILLVTDDYNAPVLGKDDFIMPAANSLDVDKLIEQGGDLVTDATAIAKDLRSILNRMTVEGGPLQTLVSDKKMAGEIQKTISGALAYMEQRDNLMSLFLKDTEFAEQVKSRLGSSLQNVAIFTDTFKDSTGLLPMLLSDDAYRVAFSTRLIALLDNANGYVDSLRQSKGLAYKLTQDEVYAKRISENLEAASTHLASILAKIDSGEGSASLLLNDASLYEGLYEVVYGLQHSGLSKWYIQRKQKKGAAIKEKHLKNKETL